MTNSPRLGLLNLAVFAGLASLALSAAEPISDGDRGRYRARVSELDARIAAWELARGASRDLRGAGGHGADARIFSKAVRHALDFEPVLDEAARGLIELALGTCEDRIAQLEAGKQPWREAQGRSVRGFVSAVDGSSQPYFVVVPKTYDPSKPIGLEVMLHGSMPRRSAVGELDFVLKASGVRFGAGEDFLELYPLGRLGENAYRFEGETDVFEAMEDVCRQYSVDRRRIVLRGISLGAVAAWQIGLKRPDRFAAVGPAAGPVDTRLFAAAPWPHFT
ncbi:MAG: hypothetical protein RLZZ244_915, partial [Verrucomicrobiota bacterium]